MLAAEIKLFPDKTFFIQLLIFLVVLLALNRLVFKPVLKILRLRRERTQGETERLEGLRQRSEALVKNYEAKIQEAKQEGFKIKEAIRREGEAQAQKIVQEARQAGLTQMEEIKREIEREIGEASKQLEQDVKTLAQVLAEKVLGRPLQRKH